MDDELCYISESTKLQFYMSIAEVQTYPKCRVNVQYCGKEENEAIRVSIKYLRYYNEDQIHVDT